MMFWKRYKGISFGLRQGDIHPFAAPGTSPNTESVYENRKQIVTLLNDVISRFSVWAKWEQYFFRARVLHWDANRERWLLTGAGMFKHAESTEAKNKNTIGIVDEIPESECSDTSGSSCDSSSDSSSDDELGANKDGKQMDPSANALADMHIEQLEISKTIREQGALLDDKLSDESDDAEPENIQDQGEDSKTKFVLGQSNWPLRCGEITARCHQMQKQMRTPKTDSQAGLRRTFVFVKGSSASQPIVIREFDSHIGALWHMWIRGEQLGPAIGQFKPGKRMQLMAAACLIFAAPRLLAIPVEDYKEKQLRYDCLEALVKSFSSQLWGLDKSKVNYLQFPDEMLETPDMENLWNQYTTFKKFARVAANEVVLDPSKPHTWDHILHGKLMGVNYTAVKKWGIWHMFRLYHRIMMWSTSCEAIAEHIGSMIRFIEKKHSTGRPLGAGNLVRAVLLKAAGVKGDLSDMAFVNAVLTKKMEKVNTKRHFFVLNRTRSKRAADQERLGASTTTNRVRRSQQTMSGGGRSTHAWLHESSNKLTLLKHISKRPRVAQRVTNASYLPCELDEHVWDVVSPALAKLGLSRFAAPFVQSAAA
jgi:hypothetical protein